MGIGYHLNGQVSSRDRARKTLDVLFIALAVILLSVGFMPAIAAADSNSVNFEDPPYTLGSINGQEGWIFTGPYDVEVDNNSPAYTAFGNQSLRISNAVTSGSFGDWVFSKPLSDEAGESLAQNGGSSGGTRQPYFEVAWDFASANPSTQQTGLQVSTAPDRGDGARMSFVKMYDTSNGLAVDFADYQSGKNEIGCVTGDNFVTTNVANSLDRTLPHRIKLTIQFVNGPNNDVVKLYVDGMLKHTGTSWEGYFNECEGNPTRTVDSMIFQARGGAGTAPATLGNGFLIDNLSQKSGPVPPQLPTKKDQCTKDGWKSYGSIFKNQGDCVSFISTNGKNQPNGL